MTSKDSSIIGQLLHSKSGFALVVFLAIAAFFLVAEHTAHVLGVLPYGLVALCLVMHLFMHGGHGNHGGQHKH